MNPWRRRSSPPPPIEPISREDLAWRIGASDTRPPKVEVEPAHVDRKTNVKTAAPARAKTATAANARTAIAASAGPAPAPPPVLQPRLLERPAHTVRRSIRMPYGARTHVGAEAGPRRLTL